MRKPELKLKKATEDIVKLADSIPEEPRPYWGTRLRYRWIIRPEQDGDLLALHWYDVKRIQNQKHRREAYITWIDVKNEEWITWDCNGEKWKSAMIQNLIWEGVENILMMPGWLPEEFSQAPCPENIPEHINDWQVRIRDRKLQQRQKKKDENTARLMGQAGDLPAGYLDWQEKTIMKKSRYLIYQRSGRKESETYCTNCGNFRMMRTQELKNNKTGKCPHCGSRAIMKSTGRIQHLRDESWTEYIQAIDEGLMIRCIRMIKDYRVYGAPKRYVFEPCRVVIERGKNAVWYEVRDDQTKYASSERYKRNQIEGCVIPANVPVISSGGVYKRNLWRELKKAFPYHMFREYIQRNDENSRRYGVYDYFDAYSRFPLMESLEKTGKTYLVDYLAGGKRSRFANFDAKAGTVSGMLGITKEQYRDYGNLTEEDIMRLHFLNKKKIHLTKEQYRIWVAYTTSYNWEETTEAVLRHTTMRRFLKYAKNSRRSEIMDWYKDYLKMAEKAGYDLTDDFVLFPQNIREAHDAVMDLLQQEKREKELKDAEANYTGIQKIEKKIRKAFSFQDGGYLIRPAKTNREIVSEGQALHICVGTGGYAAKMEKGSSYILFLRRKEEPDTPFYTVEITPGYNIIQRHGKYNQQGEEVKEVDAFLKKFVEVKGNGKEYHAGR